MSKVENRLFMAELTLPAVFSAPPGLEFAFDLVRVSGGLAYVSGHGPIDGSTPLMQGKVGSDLTPEQGREAARLTGLSIIASLKAAFDDLDRVTQWVKVLGLVNCAPGFSGTPGVINGFSELILELWGPERGAHARSAIGVAELPFDIPVEVEAIVEVDQEES
jgi:enamine deaminase RidA (YjgF/YER057c/UK114 family)